LGSEIILALCFCTNDISLSLSLSLFFSGYTFTMKPQTVSELGLHSGYTPIHSKPGVGGLPQTGSEAMMSSRGRGEPAPLLRVVCGGGVGGWGRGYRSTLEPSEPSDLKPKKHPPPTSSTHLLAHSVV
jgi:hypothetical protein